MAKKFYEASTACIRAIDLIKIANQLLNDNMQYAQISIVYSSNDDENGSVLIDAIDSIDPSETVHYPPIKSFTAIDTDVFGFRN